MASLTSCETVVLRLQGRAKLSRESAMADSQTKLAVKPMLSMHKGLIHELRNNSHQQSPQLVRRHFRNVARRLRHDRAFAWRLSRLCRATGTGRAKRPESGFLNMLLSPVLERLLINPDLAQLLLKALRDALPSCDFPYLGTVSAHMHGIQLL